MAQLLNDTGSNPRDVCAPVSMKYMYRCKKTAISFVENRKTRIFAVISPSAVAKASHFIGKTNKR